MALSWQRDTSVLCFEALHANELLEGSFTLAGQARGFAHTVFSTVAEVGIELLNKHTAASRIPPSALADLVGGAPKSPVHSGNEKVKHSWVATEKLLSCSE